MYVYKEAVLPSKINYEMCHIDRVCSEMKLKRFSLSRGPHMLSRASHENVIVIT